MKKKLLSALLCVAMVASLVVGCGAKEEAPAAEAPAATEEAAKEEAPAADTMEGTHVFMFKSTGNTFGDLMYEGFEEYLTGLGEKTAYKSPAETTVAAQVQLLDELVTQKVASITISTNGDAGYDEVFKKAQEAGIPIVSVDSEASIDYRVCHVNQAETFDIGSYLVQAAVLITLGIDYPENGDMKAAQVAQMRAVRIISVLKKYMIRP